MNLLGLILALASVGSLTLGMLLVFRKFYCDSKDSEACDRGQYELARKYRNHSNRLDRPTEILLITAAIFAFVACIIDKDIMIPRNGGGNDNFARIAIAWYLIFRNHK